MAALFAHAFQQTDAQNFPLETVSPDQLKNLKLRKKPLE